MIQLNHRFYPLIRPTLVGVGIVFALQSSAIAQVKPPEAFFKASRDCAAKPAIKGDNPGNVTLTIEQVYPVIGLNRPNGNAVLLRIATAEPDRRWVAIDCGSFQSTAGESSAPSVTPPDPATPGPTGQPSTNPTTNPACAVGPVPKTFFDDTCTLVPVGNQAEPADISPPKPTLNAFDRRIVELCGTDFGGAVSQARFGQLMRDYPDVRQRLQNDVGGALNPGRTTPAQFITDLTAIWFNAKGFQHIFCGEQEGSDDTGIGGLHFSGRYLDLQERGIAEMIATTSKGTDAIEEVVPGVIYTFGVKVKRPNGQTINHKIKGYGYTLNAQEMLLVATKTYKTSTAQSCLITIQDTTVAPFPVQPVTFKAKFVRKDGGIRTFYPMAKPTGDDC